MSTETYREEVDAIVPDGGQGVELPDSIADAWLALETHKESPSSIVSFLECPLKWFVERHLKAMYEATGDTILGIKNFDRPPPNQWSVGGTLAHRALEVFYSEPPDKRYDDLLPEIYDFAWEMLDKGDWSDGIVSKSMVTEYRAMLETLDTDNLGRFKGRFKSNYREITLAILDMEDPMSVRVVGNESFIQLARGRMRINGKIDRVNATLKGEHKIVDYKTGKSPTGDISVFNKTFLPSGIYARSMVEATESDLAARPIVGVELMYLKDGRKFGIRTHDGVLQDVDDILHMVDSEMDAIGDTGVVPTVPSGSLNEMPCKYCFIRDVCPEWN